MSAAPRTAPAGTPADGLRDDPVVIGATGGSGTRVVARLVQRAGFDLGSGLNAAEDHLGIAAALDRRLNRWLTRDAGDEEILDDLRAVLATHEGAAAGRPWGWKEPRSIFVLALLVRALPRMRFIHVVRDGRDMAFSSNQNQVRKHGRAFLGDGEDAPTPERSLALWARLNGAAADLGESALGDRYLRLRFEDVCADPVAAAGRVGAFLGVDADAPALARVVESPPSIGRWRAADPATVARLQAVGGDALARFGYA